MVPVAFHVNYWDYIGWPDRFASARYSERQRDYARQGHISNVYTPGLVLSGVEWRSWFRLPVLELPAPVEVGELALRVEAGRVDARFAALLPMPAEAELHVALLGFDLSSEVNAGENRGRKLEHDFVVLGYASYPMTEEGGALVSAGALPAASVESTKHAVAAWVSLPGDQRPVQAVGGWLSASDLNH